MRSKRTNQCTNQCFNVSVGFAAILATRFVSQSHPVTHPTNSSHQQSPLDRGSFIHFGGVGGTSSIPKSAHFPTGHGVSFWFPFKPTRKEVPSNAQLSHCQNLGRCRWLALQYKNVFARPPWSIFGWCSALIPCLWFLSRCHLVVWVSKKQSQLGTPFQYRDLSMTRLLFPSPLRLLGRLYTREAWLRHLLDALSVALCASHTDEAMGGGWVGGPARANGRAQPGQAYSSFESVPWALQDEIIASKIN